MSDYDLTDGGRRRIVCADQERNLREQAELRALFDRELAAGRGVACSFPETAERIERDEKRWDELGEGSLDPGDWDPA